MYFLRDASGIAKVPLIYYSVIKNQSANIKMEVYKMSEILQFSNRAEFRNWLMENHDSDQGVWLVFGKKGGPKTIKAGEALEEALCFGWIDGQMNQIDSEKYIKYFKRRQKKSRWSEKNKNIVRNLRTKGLMTEFGEKAVEEAKQNGMWNLPRPVPISPDQVDAFEKILRPHQLAHENFKAMSPSVQRNFTGFYFDAKTENGRKNRLEKIISRLNENKKLM